MLTALWLLLASVYGAICAQAAYLEYNITWVSRNPDGLHERPVMGINDQWPIPALRVTKGEQVVIKVRNHLGNETTSLHWHGLYMNGTAYMDGPPGVAQCEIPPGDSFVYDFKVCYIKVLHFALLGLTNIGRPTGDILVPFTHERPIS